MDDRETSPTPLPAGVRPAGAPAGAADALDSAAWARLAAAVAERGDQSAFMRIYDHFAPRLRRYLSNLGAAGAQADELVQDTMLALWRKAALFDPSRASLDAWLFRVARNLYIDRARREPHWRPLQEGLDHLDAACLAALEPAPEGFVDQRALGAAIDRLPALQARLVRMSYLEAHSHREIAQALGMPIGSVKSALHRAMERLRAAMGAPA